MQAIVGGIASHGHEAAAKVEASDSAESQNGRKEDDLERVAVFKGLVALGGVYFFFMAEKLVSLISEYRAEKKAAKEERERCLRNPRRSMEPRRMSHVRVSIPSAGTLDGNLLKGSRLFDPTCRRQSRAMSIAGEEILTTGLTSKGEMNSTYFDFLRLKKIFVPKLEGCDL
ncbi:unnamed protein product [Protopolystoma xenopodis]|uniref:Uncharacterized protein n=1 Tax=Protopolystoma xenopodis TaxID=117903 RepID=A0A448XP15_9PLAT|nr:unnamed protein product [Protopolystoma xenopodis]